MDDDVALVERLRSGDESAFAELVARYQPRLLRLATSVTGRRDVAEEVAQDTWLGVVRGVERFEGRSTFKTWLFHILMNRAHTAVGREIRAGRPDDTVGERFDSSGAWATPPVPWSDQVDDRVVAEVLAPRVHDLLAQLPEAQRTVVVLRDVEALSADEVASLLGLSAGNQRVILHRGRARLRELLAAEMGTR